ncbi:MAG: TonB-dependent receptor [Pseudomonadota bacterium]|jgi:TonB-dependent receptor|nr:TonB-dependent receptor [Pseudomonadota bacterium]
MRHFNKPTAKLRLLAGCAPAGLVLAAALGGMAAAQDSAETSTNDVITVTGYRQSLAAALDVKRDSSGVVDAIVAEDIAAFPDLNLAESIQRIPGISINRVAGEGRQITVRGLGADFTRVRINGMEALSTTGGSDASGGSNRGRGFDFNTFASDLFNEIRVTKTTSASMDEGSLGATVDLRTARALDYDPGLTAAVSAQMGYNSLSEETSPRIAGLVSWTNDDRSFGANLSLAYTDRTIIEEGFSTVRWQDGNFRSVNGQPCPAGPGCSDIDTNSLVYHPRIPRYGRLTNEQERIGLTGGLQFRPSERTTISLDALYSRFDATREENFLEVFFRSQEGVIDVRDYTIDASRNIMDSGTFDISGNANGTHPIRSEGRFDELTTDFTQFTLDVEHDFTDRLRGQFIAGTVESEFDNPVQTTILFDAVGDVTGYSYDFRNSHNTPAIDFGSLDVTDPSQFQFTEVRDRPQSVTNSFDTISGSLEYDVNDNWSVSGGISFKQYDFETREARRENTNGSVVCNLPGVNCPAGATGLPITSDLYTVLTGFGSGLGMPGGNDTAWIIPNIQAAAAAAGIYSIPGSVQAGNQRSVSEEDLGGFIQADFQTMLGSIPVRGDIGVRYVETTTTATGLVSGTEVTVERSYQDTLPSLNIAFDMTDEFVIRLGAAKVMARPSLGNLTPGGSLDSFNGPPFRYNAGNPGLDPYRANTYDASFEWYFAEEALFAVSVFYKDVSSFFTSSQSVEVAYSQSGLPASLPPASSPLYNLIQGGGDPLVEISQVSNGGDASVQGFEVAYQQPFTFLPEPFHNFGFQGNYTYVDSDEINGFSPNAYNATLYYEDERLSARISAAYRDAYVTRDANSAGRDERGVDSSFNLDFASSYQLNEMIDLTFEAINLTDEFEQQIFDAGDLVNVYHHTGTEYLFGIRARF